ncbi:hypothetical protein UlMin_009731 [Ulmus minor]
MGVLRHHYYLLSAITALTFLLVASASAVTQLAHEREETASGALERVLNQKRLAGPGSSPPSCRSKCGRCSPCKAVHVPIQPGMSMPLEYYPEAWRCKCGNKLFMP